MRPTGHIRERSSGSWELRYSLGTDPATGKRQTVTTTVRGDRRVAEKELRRLLRSVDTGEHVDPSRLSVRHWLTTWLATVREEVSPKTYERIQRSRGISLYQPLVILSWASLRPATFKKHTMAGRWADGGMEKQAVFRPARVATFIAFCARR
jgi:hypothetical protein